MTTPVLLIAIVQEQDSDRLMGELTRAGLSATRISSVGGFLHEQNETLLMGLGTDDVERVLRILRQTCHTRTTLINALHSPAESGTTPWIAPIEVRIGGATTFVLPLQQLEHNGDAPVTSGAPEQRGKMKLILAVVPGGDASRVIEALTSHDFRVTHISTTGAFLRKQNSTLLVGVESDRLEQALELVREASGAESKSVTGKTTSRATMFVLDVQHYEHI